jgi:hypothetical protein
VVKNKADEQQLFKMTDIRRLSRDHDISSVENEEQMKHRFPNEKSLRGLLKL